MGALGFKDFQKLSGGLKWPHDLVKEHAQCFVQNITTNTHANAWGRPTSPAKDHKIHWGALWSDKDQR